MTWGTAAGHSTVLWPTVTDLLRAEGFEVVLASVGDLPALRTSSVRRVIAASRGRLTVLPRRPRRPRHHDADRPWRTPESSVRKRDPVRHGRSARRCVTSDRPRSAWTSASCPTPVGTSTRWPISGSRPARHGSGDRVAAGSGARGAGALPARGGDRPAGVESLTVLADGGPESVPVLRIRRRPGTPGAGSPSACRAGGGRPPLLGLNLRSEVRSLSAWRPPSWPEPSWRRWSSWPGSPSWPAWWSWRLSVLLGAVVLAAVALAAGALVAVRLRRAAALSPAPSSSPPPWPEPPWSPVPSSRSSWPPARRRPWWRPSWRPGP